jgi:N utilization substance protein B
MGNQRNAREAALKILFQMDLAGIPVEEAITNYWRHFDSEADYSEHANVLVRGVAEHLADLDRAIGGVSTKWRIERMTFVDRNILRIGTHGLLFLDDLPAPVIINEAIELGKRFGSEESGAFINGVLDHIAPRETP